MRFCSQGGSVSVPAEPREHSLKDIAIRICHVISGDLWAGAEAMAFNLLTGLAAYPDVDLRVVVLNRGKLSNDLSRVGIPVDLVPEGKLSLLALARSIARVVKECRAQVLHSHRYKENLLAYLASIVSTHKNALVSTQHGLPEPTAGSRRLIHRAVARTNYLVLASRFDCVVAVSSDLKKAMSEELSLPENKVRVVHNGVRVSNPARANESNARDLFVVGSLGRFVPVKDYILMADVAREMATKVMDFRFELAGEGPMLEAINARVRDHGLGDRFVIRGPIDAVDTFHRGLDAYISTSQHEGIPMSVLEAMANGIPVVAPSVGGLKEIVDDGVNGLLVRGRDPRDFAEKCLRLAKDDRLRSVLGHAARDKVRNHFSVERMVEGYREIYEGLIEDRGL